jgi:hypothetical protein
MRAIGARPIVAALATLALYVLALIAPQLLNDGDTYLHITAGQWMLEHGQVLRSDPFSYTLGDSPWQAHEWLSEILMAAAFATGGWSGVVTLFALAAGAAAGLFAWALGRRLQGLALYATLVFALLCLLPGLLARPHILALPVLILWSAGVISAAEAGKRPSLWLLPLMILWANLHGSFLFGLALLVPFALEAMLAFPDKRIALARNWGLFALAAVIAAMITPFGVDTLLLPLRLMGAENLARVGEWQSPNSLQLVPIELALAAVLYVFFLRGGRMPILRLLVLLGLLHEVLQHVRHEMLFGLVGALVIAGPLAETLRKSEIVPAGADSTNRRVPWLGAGVLVLALIALGGWRMAVPVTLSNNDSAPITALNAVPEDLRIEPVLNDYAFGGYLIGQGIRPFIDSRVELYSGASLNTYLKLIQPDKATLDRVLYRYRIGWTILSPTNPLVGLLDQRPGWQRLYSGPFAVVHVRATKDSRSDKSDK